ncbi:MAG: DciA family protein [Phycisphaerae bacterium]
MSALFEGPAGGHVLRAAARGLRRRERARRELASVLRPEWLRATRVERLERGTLELAVSDPVVRVQLRRAAQGLQRQLAQRIPGLRRLVVTCTGQAAPHVD